MELTLIEAQQMRDTVLTLLDQMEGKSNCQSFLRWYNDLNDLHDELYMECKHLARGNANTYFFFNLDSKPSDGVMIFKSDANDIEQVREEIEDLNMFGEDLSVFDNKAEAEEALLVGDNLLLAKFLKKNGDLKGMEKMLKPALEKFMKESGYLS
jgi:hypothetical protein